MSAYPDIQSKVVEVPSKCYHNTSCMGGEDASIQIHPLMLTQWLYDYGRDGWRLAQIIERTAIFQRKEPRY